MIRTSGSRVKEFLRCMRAGYWAYEYKGGWQSGRIDIALSTGSWCHQVVEGLLTGGNASTVIAAAKTAALSGEASDEPGVERTRQEQAALVEAFGWAFVRARYGAIHREYEIVDVEREEETALAGDVVLQARCDAVLRRRVDGRLFVYNLKTAASPDSRKWQDQWQVDQQVMTEVLAVERRLGERVYGAIIDGFVKGQRAPVWWASLKEVRDGGVSQEPKWDAQRSRLLYGYRCQDVVGRPTLYDFVGTTRKGWEKFAVWEDKGLAAQLAKGGFEQTAIEAWVHWLPLDEVEAQFVTLPPVMRTDEHVDAKVRQIVAMERRIATGAQLVEQNGRTELDVQFPQNENSCYWSSAKRCEFFEMCWGSASEDPEGFEFSKRMSNHPEAANG